MVCTLWSPDSRYIIVFCCSGCGEFFCQKTITPTRAAQNIAAFDVDLALPTSAALSGCVRAACRCLVGNAR